MEVLDSGMVSQSEDSCRMGQGEVSGTKSNSGVEKNVPSKVVGGLIKRDRGKNEERLSCQWYEGVS